MERCLRPLRQVLHLDVSVVALLGLVGGPEGEVVAQQLHDQRAVLVRLLGQRVQLRDRVVERLAEERKEGKIR
jgi:hypothetical protein